jgi:hypothetical protein
MRADVRTVSRRRRAAALTAAAVLALLGGTYYFTHEPAPHVMIRWREDATPERRAYIERFFGLVRARDPEGHAITYDLVNLQPENIEELLEQPEVAGSGYIDEATETVLADVPYGRGSMWIGDRLPEVRVYRVVPGIVAACGLVIAYALAKEIAARRRRMRRLLAFILGSRRPRFGVAGQRHGARD